MDLDGSRMDTARSVAEDFMDDRSDCSSDDGSQGSGSKKNIRPVHNIGQACKFCKKRHIRCDGNFPCTQCVKRNLQCTFGTKTKRGPKPKTDLYEHCNKLMVDLEVQKQIAEYWREQFMTAMRKHGKDGNEFVEEHGLHPPFGSSDIERAGASNGLVSSMNGPSTDLSSSSTSPVPLHAFKGENSPHSPPSDSMDLVPSSSSISSSQVMSVEASSGNRNGSGAVYVPHISHRDPKPILSIDQLTSMYGLFSSHIQPLVPDYVVSFSPELCLEVWNSTKAERDEVKDSAHLTDMFEHSVVAAHGFRLATEPETMHRFAKKSEDLLQLLFFQREAQCHPELAQKLVQVLILLSFYYGGDDRDGSKQSVIMLAYQIISMHRTHIAPATMHRVYYTMMSLSENQADRVYWFNQASSLATQMKIKSLASITAASMMFIFSSLHPKANFDQAPPSFTKPQLSAFLKKIDEARNFFITTNTTVDGMPLTQEAVSTFSVLMNGCRSELLFLLGEFQSAQTTAQWTIEAGASLQRPVHMSMFGVQCAAEVALAMHMTPATQLALTMFERHSAALPITNRFRRRIMSQINLQHSPVDSMMAVATSSTNGPATTGGTAGVLSASSDMLQQDFMQGGLMNEDLGFGMGSIGLNQLPTTDPHFGTQPNQIRTPQQFRQIPSLRMSGSVPSDDSLIMYNDDYPNFS
jgi:hypothetical protein